MLSGQTAEYPDILPAPVRGWPPCPAYRSMIVLILSCRSTIAVLAGRYSFR